MVSNRKILFWQQHQLRLFYGEVYNSTETIGVIYFGGTGSKQSIFRIDEFRGISIVVSKDDAVVETPEIRFLRKWRRFPAGTIMQIAEEKG